MQLETNIFILTDEWQDIRDKHFIKFIGRSNELGPVEVIFSNNKPVFFIDRNTILPHLPFPYKRKEVELKDFNSNNVDCLYFQTQRDLKKAELILSQNNIKTYESDINPSKRFLMERFINAQAKIIGEAINAEGITRFINPKIEPISFETKFKVASLDIETGVDNSIYSIALHITFEEKEIKKVFMRGKGKETKLISYYEEEKILIENFIDYFIREDPDFLIGWHIVGFDLLFIKKRCEELNINFNIGRRKSSITIREREDRNYFVYIPGRIVLDGPFALRSAFYTFDDYKLETVAQNLLGTGKLITPEQNKVAEIENLFQTNKKKLAEYNLEDAILVSDIFMKTGLIELCVTRAKLSGLLIDQLYMMTAAFDHFYLPRIHRKGFVAPNIKDLISTSHSAGGYVIEPEPGIYNDVCVLDFKSLYPSIIRTFSIDPYSLLKNEINTITTPNNFKFSKTEHILPDFINQLLEKRNEAKKNSDKYLSQAIKILMNSFYGVMGSYGCRFYNPNLPSAITGTGQWLLIQSKNFLEENGYKVVYGDTDSLFVQIPEEKRDNHLNEGEIISNLLNNYWVERLKNEFSLNSFLEIEFEKHYKILVLTQSRGGEAGAKKRYAGWIKQNDEDKIEFIGMESVRSDWTQLSKDFQNELYRRFFTGMEINSWIRKVVYDLKDGKFDNKLIYKKRLRKNIEQYVKNVPPHVKAARMINQKYGSVYYLITYKGPVPTSLKPENIDYEHYIEKQLSPVADSLLTLLGESFDKIVNSNQYEMFN